MATLILKIFMFVGARRRMKPDSLSTTSSDYKRMSLEHIQMIFERLKNSKNRKSTQKNYHCIWKILNKFLIQLDDIPVIWEQHICMFGTYLVNRGSQSATLRSYVSAIKNILRNEGIKIEDEKIMLGTLVRACKIENDKIYIRLPIKLNLLEALLFVLERKFSSPINNQPYLEILYKAMFLLAFYGLFRVGEIAQGDHVIKAKNIHIGQNKNKTLVVLYSSKTHAKESQPQKVKICALENKEKSKRFFCPFKALRAYAQIQGAYHHSNEQFFIFADRSPVTPVQIRTVLKDLIKRIGLDNQLYDMHSLQIGMASQMLQNGIPVDQICIYGRWKSNAVFRYLRN